MKNEISLARILLATACPISSTLWAGSFAINDFKHLGKDQASQNNPK